ncbi:WD repeat-containing protein 76-like [Antedon mediterranea]|uniref:WD repeat-containing protein 76-like n=1 Tax=Antedon mediterranea TaxID=105859 RepID=UPI003AF5F25E
MRQRNIEENKKFFASLEIFQTKKDMLMFTPNGTKKSTTRGLKSEKKKAEQIVLRPRSLRLQNISPSGEYMPVEMVEPEKRQTRKLAGPIPMVPTNIKNEGKENLTTGFSDCVQCLHNRSTETHSPRHNKFVEALKNLKLTEEKVAKVVPNRICSVIAHPSSSKLLVGVGDKWGHVGLWDVDSKEDNDGVYLFEPHCKQVPSLKFAPANSEKLFTCSYDGTVKCGDLNNMVFNDIYSTDPEEDLWISYMDLLSPDGSQLLVSQNRKNAYVALVDQRKSSSSVPSYMLHDRKIKTLSIHPQKRNHFITASNDRTVALWDLRMLKEQGTNKPLEVIRHTRAVSSAFFSPITGRKVLSTSFDDHIRIAEFNESGSTAGFELKLKLRHNNQTGRWVSNFRAQWHPQLEDIFVVGCMDRPRRIEIYSTDGNVLHNCMDDEYLASICSINEFHPSRDILIGGNSSGRVHVFM